MPEDIYEIIALGARWWFLLLGALIVLRAFGWLRRDRKSEKRRLRQLPDAGMVGEMVVLQGGDDLEEGLVFPVPREGTLGCFRSCDIVVPVEGIAPQHCDFSFCNGKGLLIYPRRGCMVTVDGEDFTGLRAAKKHPMGHGSRLYIGDAVLRLRLFEGLETEAVMHAHSAYQPEDVLSHEATQAAWQQTSSVYHQVPVAWRDVTAPVQPVEQHQAGWQQPQPWQQNPYAPPPPQPWQMQQEPVWMNQPMQPVSAEEDRPRAQERRYRSRRRRGDEQA